MCLQQTYACVACCVVAALWCHVQSVAELEASRDELSSRAAAAADNAARLSTTLQDLEQQRSGLARKLSV